jgi:hypothetical protein
MTGFRLPPHTRRFLLWGARLAFLAYLVQIVAIDHWHTHPTDIYGVEGTSAHVAHCHGAGDCSDGSAVASPALAERATLPMPPATTSFPQHDTDTAPAAAFAETLLQPPRAA